MNIDTYTASYDSLLAAEEKNSTSKADIMAMFVDTCEKAMFEAGFVPSEGEELVETLILPQLEDLKQKFAALDAEALDIYRASGLDEREVRWRNFTNARLSFAQRRRIKKIADKLELLGDLQISFANMYAVVVRHRPDLLEKYGELEIVTTEGK